MFYQAFFGPCLSVSEEGLFQIIVYQFIIKQEIWCCFGFVYQRLNENSLDDTKKSHQNGSSFVQANPVGMVDIKQAVKRSATPAFKNSVTQSQ